MLYLFIFVAWCDGVILSAVFNRVFPDWFGRDVQEKLERCYRIEVHMIEVHMIAFSICGYIWG